MEENVNVSTHQTSDLYFNVLSVGGDRERMTSNHETYLLMASTQNDMEDWVKSIRRVIWAPFGGGELLQPVCQNKSLFVNGYKQAGHSLTYTASTLLYIILLHRYCTLTIERSHIIFEALLAT